VIEERLRNADPEVLLKYFGTSSIGELTSYENKEQLVVFFEGLGAFLDAAGVCHFTNSLRLDMLLPDDYAELFSAATGVNIDWRGLLFIGEKIHNVERAFNVLHTGWTRKTTCLQEDSLRSAWLVSTPLT